MFLHILTSDHVKKKLEAMNERDQEALQFKLSSAFEEFLEGDVFDVSCVSNFCAGLSSKFPFKALVHHHEDGENLFILIDLIDDKNFLAPTNNTVH